MHASGCNHKGTYVLLIVSSKLRLNDQEGALALKIALFRERRIFPVWPQRIVILLLATVTLALVLPTQHVPVANAQDNSATVTLVTYVNTNATEGSRGDTAAIILVLNRTLEAGERVTVPLEFQGGTLNADFRLHLNRPRFTHSHTCAPFDSTVCHDYTHGEQGTREHAHNDAKNVALSGQTVTFTGPTEVPGTLHYQPAEGGTQVVISLTGNEDSDIEDERIRVSLGNISSVGISGGVTGKRSGSGWYTIEDNDKPPAAVNVTETNGSTSVGENRETDTYTVVLNSVPRNDVAITITSGNPGMVTVNKLGGIAGATQTLTFTSSTWNQAQTITVTGVNDHVHNPGRSSTITHRASSTDSNYNNINVQNVMVTVTDDDLAPTLVVLSVSDSSVPEDIGPQTIRVRAQVDGASFFGTAQTVAVTVASSGGQNVVGFIATPHSFHITIDAGQRYGERTFTLAPTDNSVEENNETITVSGTLSGVTVTSASITLTDDDAPPEALPEVNFAAESSTVSENAGTHHVSITLDAAPSTNILVSYYLTGGTAILGSDFTISGITSVIGTVSVSSGATNVNIPIAIINDSDGESSETIELTIRQGTNSPYTLGDDIDHTVTITDDDGTIPHRQQYRPPTPSPMVNFATSSSSAGESAGTRSVSLTLNPAPTSAITVRYALSGTALRGTDYTISRVNGNTGTVSVSSRATRVTIPIAITNDSDNENNKTIILRLTGGTGYVLGTRRSH